MTILTSESSFFRELFIESFIDTTCEYYTSRIKATREYSDGLCYTGYLWDCMKQRQIVSQNYILQSMQNNTANIYIFWDIHSHDHILIEDYWKYPKDAILSVLPSEVNDILPTLPEDCYFFDNTLSWAAALTHEEIKPGRRLCFYLEQNH